MRDFGSAANRSHAGAAHTVRLSQATKETIR